MVLSTRPRTGGDAGTGKIWNSPALAFAGIGWYLATSILLPTGIGVWADRKFETDPWLTLFGVGFGMFIGFYGAYRQLQDVLRRQHQTGDGLDDGESR